MGRASKDKRDIYYRKAKEEGYRARSAYKLLQIHEEFNILSDEEITTGAVDLCAAPGSWSQVLASHFRRIVQEREHRTTCADNGSSGNAEEEREDRSAAVKPRIVAVDLQEMAPIEGVSILQGDITSEATARKIIELLNAKDDGAEDEGGSGERSGERARPCKEEVEEEGEELYSKKTRTEASPEASTALRRSSTGKALRKADIVVCDGAPDVTGMHELDEYLQHQLLLAALTITTCVLRRGGAFVTKMFRGPNTAFLVAKAELFFRQVRVVKPKSSRNASMESFLVCQGFFIPAGYVPRFLNANGSTLNTHSPECEGEKDEASSAAAGTAAAAAKGEGDCFTPEAPLYGYSPTTTECSGSSGSGGGPQLVQRHLLPFLSCGDLSGFDADMCYDREKGSTVLAPVQPPIEAPYLKKAAAPP